MSTSCGATCRISAATARLQTALRQKLLDRLNTVDIEADPVSLKRKLFIFCSARMSRKRWIASRLTWMLLKPLGCQGPCGRRLDFLMQELNREANTLGSKSTALSTTNVSVEFKVLIEQMREQIQNIE